MSPRDSILVLNVGSSSVKFRVFGTDDAMSLLADGRVTGIGSRPVFGITGYGERELPLELSQKAALKVILDWVQSDDSTGRVVAVGHRIVHGGESYHQPLVLDDQVLRRLDAFVPLAPLHQPHGLAAVRATAELYPGLPQVGCFDTGFHAGHDPVIQNYALPKDLRTRGIRRYGFHGLSYEWVAYLLGSDEEGVPERVVAAHLGNGASLCAMLRGRSVDTTMGMTALEGLPMGTRSGSLDPGAVIYLLRQIGLSVDQVEDTLYNHSGLKGLSDGISDMRKLLAAETPEAHLAVSHFIHKTAQYVAQMAVSLGGMDMLVFTGGIGENAAPVRNGVVDKLSFMPPFAVRIIEADEERMIARHTRKVAVR